MSNSNRINEWLLGHEPEPDLGHEPEPDLGYAVEELELDEVIMLTGVKWIGTTMV